jgi:hypothetical protein
MLNARMSHPAMRHSRRVYTTLREIPGLLAGISESCKHSLALHPAAFDHGMRRLEVCRIDWPDDL